MIIIYSTYSTTALFKDLNLKNVLFLTVFCIFYIVALTEPVIQQLTETEHRRVCGEQEGKKGRT